MLFNNPLNPAAVVYPREDLELLARYCQEFDTVAICDEVWEHVVFDGREHIPLITIPGMRERTIKVGSRRQDLFADRLEDRLCLRRAAAAAGGGEGAPVPHLHDRTQSAGRGRLRARQAGGVFLRACARNWRAAATGSPRDWKASAFPCCKSQGTYFLTVDLSPLGLNETDEAFCKRIVSDYKVAAIPVSAFYEQDAVTSVVRFCFSKKDATLDTALERLSDAVHRRKR